MALIRAAIGLLGPLAGVRWRSVDDAGSAAQIRVEAASLYSFSTD
jgi:hypothetical protein